MALGDAGEGVIITQVVPHFESTLPAVEAYRAALQAFAPQAAPSFGSLEGYVAARVLCHALASASGAIGRETVIDSLESLGIFDIGLGTTLELGPDKHQACHQVWPTVIRGGRVVPMEWSELASRSGV